MMIIKLMIKVDISKILILILYILEVKLLISFLIEVYNIVGREIIVIVLGVCLFIIVLVIVFVIVLICKKDNGSKLNLI